MDLFDEFVVIKTCLHSWFLITACACPQNKLINFLKIVELSATSEKLIFIGRKFPLTQESIFRYVISETSSGKSGKSKKIRRKLSP